jgi:tRNA 5-methylaminomethyl-2-thiouridine biosynthesis bifunctional protein
MANGMPLPAPFLSALGLPERWRQRSRFVMLDTDFGSGSGFLATWMAWRNDPLRPRHLHFLALLPRATAPTDLSAPEPGAPEWAALLGQLRTAWPPSVPGLQRVALESGRIVLDVLHYTPSTGDADGLAQVDAKVDAFFVHAASVKPHQAKLLTHLAAPDASLAVAQLNPQDRAALHAVGFHWQAQVGLPSASLCSSAILRARRMRNAPAPIGPRRHAIVIGAGLAGAAACERLAARGWRIDLIESHRQPAQASSGNLAGIFMPTVSLDDNRATRLTRAAHLFSLQHWHRLGGIGTAFPGEQCGVLQLARDAAHAQAQQAIAARWHYPHRFAQWCDSAAASAILGDPGNHGNHAPHGGWLFADGGWAHPGGLCQTMLDACGSQLLTHFGQQACQLERVGGLWQVRDARQHCIASAPVVIIANGGGASGLRQSAPLPLAQIRGQVTYLDPNALPAPPVFPLVICGAAYLTRPWQGWCSVGATYDSDADPALRASSQDDNLRRLRQFLPRAGDALIGALDDAPLAGRVGFRSVAPDRLPLVGALPDYTRQPDARIERLRDVPRWPGLYGLLGYASRGLTWSALAAELLASQLEGEPLPLERDLAAALDPARFLLKTLRRRG